MKTITTLLIAVAASFSLNVSADSGDLHNDPGMGDVFPMENVVLKEQQRTPYEVFSFERTTINEQQRTPYIADTGKEVWSVEYEQWVNPADFNVTTKVITVADILRELETNPPASNGMSFDPVFKYDETAGEYQLQ